MKRTEIFIYDFIGHDPWTGEGMSAKNFATLLRAAEKDFDIIDVRINSPGGLVSDGIAIANLIAQSEKEVNTIIDGIAYSMGAVIALSGKKVSAAKNTTLLIHNCWGFAMGNAKDFRAELEMMDKLDNSLSMTIAARTGLKKDDVFKTWFDYTDHTISATEALDAKLIHEVLDIEGNVPADLKNASFEQAMAYFRKQGESKSKKTFTDFIKSLIPAGSKGEQQERIAALESQLSNLDALTQENENLTAENAALKNEKVELNEKIRAASLTITTLTDENKILKGEPAAGGKTPKSDKEGDQEDGKETGTLTSVDQQAREQAKKYGQKTQ